MKVQSEPHLFLQNRDFVQASHTADVLVAEANGFERDTKESKSETSHLYRENVLLISTDDVRVQITPSGDDVSPRAELLVQVAAGQVIIIQDIRLK